MKRLFIAFDIDDQLRRELAQRAEGLRAELDALADAVRWLPPDRYHMTAVFLGETEESAIPALRELLQTPELPGKLHTRLGSPLVFPKPREPRVLVCSLDRGVDPLKSVTEEIRHGLGRLGVDFDGKPFRPHITLGYLRKRPRQTQREIGETWLRQLQLEAEGGKVSSLSLYESLLNPEGPQHTRLFSRPLDR